MILIGCDDVGPAKYLAEFAKQFPEMVLCIASPLALSIFERLNIKIIKNIDEVESVDAVISGTSLGDAESSIDKQLILWAKARRIPCIAIIEHWSWYRKRFESKRGLLLPDYIIVNDEIAKKGAISEGIPSEIIRPLGNPYLEKLSSCNIKGRNPKKLKKRYGFPPEKRIIVFISEEIKDSFKEGTSDYLGYDEYKVLEIIKSVLKPHDFLLIKKHPEESPEKYRSSVDLNIKILNSCPLYDLVVFSDIIIGMASMLLLEVAIFRENVISFRPNGKKDFIGDELLMTTPISSKEGLIETLENGLMVPQKKHIRFAGSAGRIKNFIMEITQ